MSQGVCSAAGVGCKFAKSVGPSEFLAGAFRRLFDGEHVVVAVLPLGTDRFYQYAYAPHPSFDAAVATDAWYFCGSTSRATPDERARITRKNSDLCRTFVIVADDVGTKIDADKVKATLPPPTYALETSAGNFQWGWVLADSVEAAVADAFYRGMKSVELTDVASAKAGQVFRLPTSLHRTGWNAVMSWDGKRVPFSAMTVRVPLVEAVSRYDGWGDYQPGDEHKDIVYQELLRRGLVRRLKPDGWADIICPGWRSHTNGNPIAGYRIGGGFHCFHSHCAGRGWGDLVCWLGRQP